MYTFDIMRWIVHVRQHAAEIAAQDAHYLPQTDAAAVHADSDESRVTAEI